MNFVTMIFNKANKIIQNSETELIVTGKAIKFMQNFINKNTKK